MSLIHKALKKAEGERNPQPPQVPEEHFVGGGEGGGGGSTGGSTFPRRASWSRVALLVLLWVALGSVAYWKFLMPKRSGPQEIPPVATTDLPPPPVVEQTPLPSPTAAVPAVTPVPATTTPTDVPESIASVIQEGETLFAAGKFPEALEQFKLATEKEPSVALAWNDLGLAHKKQDNHEAAEAAYNKAIELNAAYPEALNNLGALKIAMGDRLAAALLFRKAIEADAKYPDAHFNLALLMEEEGNWRSAVEEYKAYLVHAQFSDVAFRQRIEQHVEEIVP
ncbi:MAG: tetratricopeptide repeat protein [Deltaproteobacteria bacterium]|nr:tetratricopeptide repeat protein [Deltaproteobacteria bacterium]